MAQLNEIIGRVAAYLAKQGEPAEVANRFAHGIVLQTLAYRNPTPFQHALASVAVLVSGVDVPAEAKQDMSGPKDPELIAALDGVDELDIGAVLESTLKLSPAARLDVAARLTESLFQMSYRYTEEGRAEAKQVAALQLDSLLKSLRAARRDEQLSSLQPIGEA